MKNISTILFATDFSEVSQYAFEYAATLATTYKARLVMLHVVQHQMDLRNFYVPHISFEELDRQVELSAEKKMADFYEKWREQFPDATATVVIGVPEEEILKKAVEEAASMIVMGTHGRQGLDHFLLGSTAERVVKTANCPVLTVHPVLQQQG